MTSETGRRRRWTDGHHALRRVVLFASVVVLVGVGTAGYSRLVPVTWTSTAYMEVNSGAGGAGPGDASGAQQLATSYAYVIPDDQAVINAIAAATKQPDAQIRTSIQVYAAAYSAELVLSYSADSSQLSLAGATALVSSVAHGGGALVPNTVTVVGPPTQPIPASRHRLYAFGALAALLLALSVTLVVDRLDPRVDDETELSEVLGVPVSPVQDVIGPNADLLMQRWRRLGSEGATLQLTPAESRDDERVRQVGSILGRLSTDMSVAVFGAPQAGALPTSPRGLTVLLVSRGARARTITAAASRLAMFECTPSWAVLLDGPVAESAGRPAVPAADQGRALGRRRPTPSFPDERPLSPADLAAFFSGSSDTTILPAKADGPADAGPRR